MKSKALLLSGLLCSTFAAGDAAAVTCDLYVPYSFSIVLPYVPIARGSEFTFNLNIPYGPFAGPPPPDGWYPPPLTVVFYGTKNGVNDLPDGWAYPYTLSSYGSAVLTGFGNPASGQFSGSYTRYAEIYDSNGELYCTTNSVSVVLL